MPIYTDIRTEALMAQFRAQRANAQKARKPAEKNVRAVTSDVRFSASSLRSAQGGAMSEDKVEISLAASLTVEAANGILNDSVVEQINQALQDAGIDLKTEETGEAGIDVSPRATARRIVGHAVSFLDAYQQNHAARPAASRIEGFMSLIRGAIEDGFQHARQFLEGIIKLSETIDANINRTFELANQYLDDFHQAQRNLIQSAETEPSAEPTADAGSNEAPDAPMEEI